LGRSSLISDLAFIAPDGVTLEGGVRAFSLDDAASARAMSESSSQTVVLASPAKIGCPARVRVVGWSRVETLVAAPLPAEFAKGLKKHGVAILQAS
jgi:DeoR/GlpR family transcriptional regulator of sugar metabolism